MSNNSGQPPEFNTQNANDFANILNSINPLFTRLTGQARDFTRQMSDMVRQTQQLEREFEDTFRVSYKGFDSLVLKSRDLEKEYKDLIRTVTDLQRQQDRLKDAATAANAEELAGIQKSIKTTEEEIQKKGELLRQIDENKAALEDYTKKLGYNAEQLQKAATAQDELERFTKRYETQIKATDAALGTFGRSLAQSAGMALTLDAAMHKALSGFDKIKQVNRDFVALQATLANVGKVNLGAVTGESLAGQSQKYRDDAMRLVSDFGITFEEASKRIQMISSIRPTGPISNNWREASASLAELSGKLQVTTGLSLEVQKALASQDIQGYNRDTKDVSQTLITASLAMQGLKMNAAEYSDTLSGLSDQTKIYNTDSRALTTTLYDLGRLQLNNSMQEKALAGTFGRGMAGQGLQQQLLTLQLVRQSQIGKQQGVRSLDDLFRLQRENPNLITAAKLQTGFSPFLGRGLEKTSGGRSQLETAIGGMGSAYNLDQQTIETLQVLVSQGKDLNEVIGTFAKPGPTTKQIQGQASAVQTGFGAFQKLFVNPFQVSSEKQTRDLGEIFKGPFDMIGGFLAQIPAQFTVANALLGIIAANSPIWEKIGGFLMGGGLFKNLGGLSSIFGKGGAVAGEVGMLGRLGGLFAKFAPILAIFTSVFGIVDNIKAGQHQGGFGGLLTGFGLRGGGGLEGAMKGAGSLGATGTMLGAGIGALFGGVGAGPGALIGGLAGTIIGAIGGFFNIETLTKGVGNALDNWWKSATSWLNNNFSNPFTSLLDTLLSPVKAFAQWIMGIASTITSVLKGKGSVGDVARSVMGSGIVDTAKKVWSGVANAASNAAGMASDAFTALTGGQAHAVVSGTTAKGNTLYNLRTAGLSGVNLQNYDQYSRTHGLQGTATMINSLARLGNAGLGFTPNITSAYATYGHKSHGSGTDYDVGLKGVTGEQMSKMALALATDPSVSVVGWSGNVAAMNSMLKMNGLREVFQRWPNHSDHFHVRLAAQAGKKNNYMAAADKAAAKYGVDPNVLKRLIQTESGYNPNAKNKTSGALGIAQFMPETAKGMGINPMDPYQSIDAAAKYLKENVNSFGSYRLGLSAYNEGPNALRAAHNIPNTQAAAYANKILGSTMSPIASGKGSQGSSTTIINQHFHGPADPNKVRDAARDALNEKTKKQNAVQTKIASRQRPPIS